MSDINVRTAPAADVAAGVREARDLLIARFLGVEQCCDSRRGRVGAAELLLQRVAEHLRDRAVHELDDAVAVDAEYCVSREMEDALLGRDSAALKVPLCN
jgi:hypothetical protein